MPRRPSQSLSIKLLTKSVSGLSYLAPVCLRFLYLAWRLFFVVFKQLFTCKIFLRILHLRFVAIGWLGVIGLWFLGGLFILIYAVFGDTCAAIDEWTTNPRNGTAFDIIVRCELNHTKPPRGRRHTSMVLPVAGDEDEIVFPEYKPLSDLSLHHLLPALIPPLPKFKSPKDTTDEEETSFPEYKIFLNDKSSKDTTDEEEETPFPEYKSFLNDERLNWDDDDDDDPNDASPQKREFWAELAVQQNDAASENESCTILREAFVPILETISRYNCPGILRNTLWVTLALVVVSGGCMFSICLWIVITRRSTMRWRKMVPAADDQLPFYAYVFQDLSAAPVPVPMPKKKNNNQYVEEYRNSNNGVGGGGGVGANPNYNARARRAGHVYDNPAEMARSAYAERRRRENSRR